MWSRACERVLRETDPRNENMRSNPNWWWNNGCSQLLGEELTTAENKKKSRSGGRSSHKYYITLNSSSLGDLSWRVACEGVVYDKSFPRKRFACERVAPKRLVLATYKTSLALTWQITDPGSSTCVHFSCKPEGFKASVSKSLTKGAHTYLNWLTHAKLCRTQVKQMMWFGHQMQMKHTFLRVCPIGQAKLFAAK